MKLILISDSHGSKEGIDKIFKEMEFDYFFFMGDGLGDLGDYIYLENVFAVSGNCDFFSRIENEKFIELQGIRIFLTHGNKYGVKSNLTKLIDKAEDLKVNFVFYGHTHKQVVEKFNNIYYINPGKFYKSAEGNCVGLKILIDENEFRVEQFKV